MNTTRDIAAVNRFGPIELLSNIPKPSGDIHTDAQDYDYKMFDQRPATSPRFFEQDIKQYNTSIEKLCVFIEGITIGGSITFLSTKTIADRGALISQSVENWIPKNAVKYSTSRFDITTEVLQFCFKNNLLKYLNPTISLIEEFFPSFQEPYLEIEKDPESDRKWLTFDIEVNGKIEDVLKHYNNYITQFVSTIPWPERESFRLSYNII